MLRAKSKQKPILTLPQLLKANPDALKTSHGLKISRKGPLPAKDDVPLCGVVSEKDFVASNAIDNILASVPKPEPQGRDYLKKQDYGKVPAYIEKIKVDIEKENKLAERLREEAQAAAEAKRRLLPAVERASVIESLKAKWERVNAEYQQMTHMTVLDTMSKVRRKETFEAELTQIEKDIALLGRNEDIYIDLEH